MDISYIINHFGEERENYFQSIAPPLVQASNFCFANVETMRTAVPNEKENHFYTRGNNPTTDILCKKLAALEGAEDALVFASGVAAISAAVISQVKAGNHIICVDKPYSWATKLLKNILGRFGVSYTFVDGTQLQSFEAALQFNTRLVYLESPNTFTFELQDIEQVSQWAKSHGLVTILDNSYATPLYQPAIAMGVDIVVHSASKYYGGHSDMVAGVVCANKVIIESIFYSEFLNLGAIISPHDAWLMLRSLRTLPLRLERSNITTPKIVEYLATHPKVEKVIYPMHPSFPQHGLAQKQMKGAGGLFSILLKAGTFSEVDTFVNKLNRFLIACSWGGHESLVMPVCGLVQQADELHPKLPWNLIRFYIGLEEAEVLIADLEQALS
ncbi:MAG: aminotransferase class I/II-fold pyridoxal phosphate-dependent enzyme [Chitinophagales bacterium]|nr:aminotransferase class I/II-fold pyridoxal phosphate-dependent enzyme [Chitinophagales bacterium]